jgi:hypothetical protein
VLLEYSLNGAKESFTSSEQLAKKAIAKDVAITDLYVKL